MSQPFRRYEILLPLRFNDGQPVPPELFEDSLADMRLRFGESCETQMTRGRWKHEEQLYRDEMMRMYVDVPDVAENRHFFVELKERLKARFQQLDIWMTTYPIERL